MEEYRWTKGNTTSTGKKFECLLVPEDSTEYCLGLFRRKGKEPDTTKEFTAAAAKFTKGLDMEGQQDHASEYGSQIPWVLPQSGN